MDELLAQHKNIALQFSGGRDSIALLLVMRPWWDKLTVYWCNPGDPLPETVALMEAVKDCVPHFVEVPGRVKQVHEEHGWPSDVLPAGAAWEFGSQTIPNHLRLVDRYTCCFKSHMQPLHERMLKDEVTLILRGQRDEDSIKGPVPNGAIVGGVQIVYPISDWTTERVNEFIASAGISLPAFYKEGVTSAPDCMHCTAWLEHGGHKYISKHYPTVGDTVQSRLQQIKVVVQPMYARLTEGAQS